MYKQPQNHNAKIPSLNLPSEYKHPGTYTRKIALKYKIKEGKNDTVTQLLKFYF